MHERARVESRGDFCKAVEGMAKSGEPGIEGVLGAVLDTCVTLLVASPQVLEAIVRANLGVGLVEVVLKLADQCTGLEVVL